MLDIFYYQQLQPLDGRQRTTLHSSSSQCVLRTRTRLLLNRSTVGPSISSPSPSLPRSRSSPCLPFNDLFVKKIAREVVPPPPPRKVVPLTEQRFMKEEQCFDLNDSDDDDDDSLFFKPSPSRHSSSIQHCHEQVEVDFQGAGKMVMVLV
ncbi:hypothetical protein EV421DRAFT_2040886 [Armillaria borealis]|uniref:Uncharacterized protein n=1 Tax=Armillaria borealis TaxID=47425 RepID=A0AA39J077_9AGAR|nr:hypothetical protein EV421DRAFT_2040886 [Armillaria borealis]